jgi:hypothetical protein
MGKSMKEFLAKVFLATMAILAPIQMVLVSVGVLILADLITGILAAHKKGEKIRSSAMRRTISKIVVYNTAVLTGFLLETYLLASIFPVAKLVAGVIGLVEFKSILENGNVILGQDIFKTVVSKLGSDNDKNS